MKLLVRNICMLIMLLFSIFPYETIQDMFAWIHTTINAIWMWIKRMFCAIFNVNPRPVIRQGVFYRR
jgi:hypothetical protein